MPEFMKEFVLPLLGPAVAFLVPTVVFHILPSRRDRRKAALDLYLVYVGEEMRAAREEVWDHFFAQVADSPQEQSRRFDEFLDYLTSAPTARNIPVER